MTRSRKQRGFSLVELVVAGSIILALAAFAVPQVVRSIRAYRLSSSAGELSNIIQRARTEAIRRNTTISARAAIIDGTWIIWIDNNGNGQFDGDESAMALTGGVTFLEAADVPSTDSMGYGDTIVPGGQIAFDARGAVDFGGGAPTVFVTFLGYVNQDELGYRAVTVLPSGKTKMWQAQESGSWTGVGHAY